MFEIGTRPNWNTRILYCSVCLYRSLGFSYVYFTNVVADMKPRFFFYDPASRVAPFTNANYVQMLNATGYEQTSTCDANKRIRFVWKVAWFDSFADYKKKKKRKNLSTTQADLVVNNKKNG